MNILVAIKLVPDLVEELEFLPDESGLDLAFSRLMPSEQDEHAIEQAILLKERYAGQVTLIGPDMSGVEDALYAAAAKGADRLIKLTGDFGAGVNSHALARAFAEHIRDLGPDLVLTGVQAHDNLDGAVGPMLAEMLDMPYVGYVAGVEAQSEVCKVRKEYPGGVVAEIEVQLPALLGIQAADQPPRYVAISKVRQAMKTATIEERSLGTLDLSGGPSIARMYEPEVGERATMFSGDEADVAGQIVALLKERGIL